MEEELFQVDHQSYFRSDAADLVVIEEKNFKFAKLLHSYWKNLDLVVADGESLKVLKFMKLERQILELVVVKFKFLKER